MKKNTLYIALILLIVHLLSPDSFAQDATSHDLYSCSSCQEVLTSEQMEKVVTILDQARPEMMELHLSLREKRQALRNLHYTVDTDPEVMVQLGTELQVQRKAIMDELRYINQRLQREVGANIRFKMPHGRGCAALQKSNFCPIYVHHSKEK